ncbi:MAG: hypothetical protein LBN05_01820 [Oscillospiraceae bacterium]|jgi:hypothetical protein|nr:hypothetical protein [Oscillospiraceae bacterium]
MPYQMKTFDNSPDLLDNILQNIAGQSDRDLAEKLICRFREARLPIKVKCHEYGTPWAWYRLSLFNAENVEVVIISTKTGYGKSAAPGLHLQIRITNMTTFEKLDALTPHIRNQILGGRDCCFCLCGCKGSDYVFAYQGQNYVKCKNIGCNFRLKDIGEDDVESVMMIVDWEAIK